MKNKIFFIIILFQICTTVFTTFIYSQNLNENTKHKYKNVLPIELIYLFPQEQLNGILIKWGTATEVNNFGFEVERSYSNDGFITLGFVQGSGNSNSPKDYTFLDTTVVKSGRIFYRLRQIDLDGFAEYSDTVDLDFPSSITLEDLDIPDKFYVSDNYPNPFNPSTKIRYSIPVNVKGEMSKVILKVYDILGKEVASLVNEVQSPGNYEVDFSDKNSASQLASGIYIYRLQYGNFISSKKMILLK